MKLLIRFAKGPSTENIKRQSSKMNFLWNFISTLCCRKLFCSSSPTRFQHHQTVTYTFNYANESKKAETLLK